MAGRSGAEAGAHVGAVLPFLQGRVGANHDRLAGKKGIRALDHPLATIPTSSTWRRSLITQKRLNSSPSSLVQRALFGTDYPFGDYRSVISIVDGLDFSSEERQSIEGGTAARLLSSRSWLNDP